LNNFKELYPSNYEPSLSHKFIKLLEDKGKLLRNYTQNIDTLEQKAGITKMVQCHGKYLIIYFIFYLKKRILNLFIYLFITY